MIKTFQNKSVVVDVTVKTNELAKNITGGTPRAVLVSPGAGVKTLTATITDAAGGVIQVTIPKALVDTAGKWFFECALAIGDQDRTVLQEDVLAARSYT